MTGTLPQSFQHQLSVANLLLKFNDVDIIFVRNDETIETRIWCRWTELCRIINVTIPNDYYSVVVVRRVILAKESLLYRSEVIDFTIDAVYMVTVEPDAL